MSVGGGEYGVRGYLAAHDAEEDGKQLWKTYTIPGPVDLRYRFTLEGATIARLEITA